MKQKEKIVLKKMQEEKARGLTDTELSYLKASGFSKKELDVLKTQKAKNWTFVRGRKP